jgi:hypothetical protein
LARQFFCGNPYEGVLTSFRVDSVPRSRHVFEGLLKNAEAVALFLSISLMLGSLHRICESDKSAAAVRSTGLRLLHFSNPEGFRGYQPCRYLRYNYKSVMMSQDNFLIIF